MLCVVIRLEYLVGKLSSVPRISCSSPEIMSIFCSNPKITSTSAFFVIFRCHFVLIVNYVERRYLSCYQGRDTYNGLHLRLAANEITAHLAKFRELIPLKT